MSTLRVVAGPAVWAAVWLFAGVASAPASDLFQLTNGSQLEGEWLNPDESPRQTYRLQLTSGVRLELNAADVASVERLSPAQASYRRAIPRLPDTLESHWTIAQKCREAGMRPEHEFHLEQVLRFDPDHADARRQLGYSHIDGRWIKPDEFRQQQGYVRYKGKWRLPQEVEIESRLEQWDQEEREWRQNFRNWRRAIARGKGKEEALNQIKSIRSSRAIPALRDALENAQELPEFKLLYVDILGQMLDSPGAAQALIDRIMKDKEINVVDRCLAKLVQDDPGKYVAAFVARLGSKDNGEINRAAFALGRLGDPSAILPLIDVLRTNHKQVITSPGLSTGFGSGGSGLSTGGGARVIDHQVDNKSVLTALTLITPDGVSYQFNEQAWREWYARWKTPPTYDLRRDQ